jgi:hypothetical protein
MNGVHGDGDGFGCCRRLSDRGLTAAVRRLLACRVTSSGAVKCSQLLQAMVRSCSSTRSVSMASVMFGSCRKMSVKYV